MASQQLCLVLALCVVLSVNAQSQLVLVYNINRHGARNVLPKTANLTENDAYGGPSLLPAGIRLCYNAGVAFRARYINDTSCGATSTCLIEPAPGDQYGNVGDPSVSYTNYDTLIRSSALDRSVISAKAFYAGVFPPVLDGPDAPTTTTFLPTGQTLVPVYTQADSDDVLVRAYTKCNAYTARLNDFYQTPEFKAKEAETQDLRNQVAAMWPGMSTDLENWWNVYDGINVWKTYRLGSPTPFDVDTPAFQPLFVNITSLAYWLETAKMRSSLTGNLLGGFLLADLVDHMEAAVAAVQINKREYYKLLTVSAHYNTQLGLLASLGIDTYPPAATLTWLRNIPKLAAVLAFELHSLPASNTFAVRAVMQDGPAASYVTIPLPCAKAGDAADTYLGSGSCTLDAFAALTAPARLNTTDAWCDACQNTDVQECRARTAQLQLAEAQKQQGGSCHGVAWKVAVGCVVTGICTAAAAYGVFAIVAARRRRRDREVEVAMRSPLPYDQAKNWTDKA